MTSPLGFLGSGVYFQSVVLNIFDCTVHCKKLKKKYTPYIENLFLPIIKDLEKSNPDGKSDAGIVDLVLFYGATNVQNAGKIVAMRYPCITVLHGTEHVVTLFFK